MENPDPSLRKQYEREVKMMYEKKLGILGRLTFLFIGLLGLFLALMFWLLSQVAFRDMSGAFGRIQGAASILFVFCLAWFLLSLWIMVSGKIKLKSQARLAVVVGWAVIVLLLFQLCDVTRHLGGPPINAEVSMVLLFFTFISLVTITFMLIGRMDRTEWKTREKLLELEYRLCELSDSVAGNDEHNEGGIDCQEK